MLTMKKQVEGQQPRRLEKAVVPNLSHARTRGSRLFEREETVVIGAILDTTLIYLKGESLDI